MIISIINKLETFSLFLAAGVFSILFLSACTDKNDGEPNCQNGIQSPCIPLNEPHPQLTDYNLYQGEMKNLDPVDALLPYDLNTQLFSDYAQKLRFVYVPEGQTVNYRTGSVLNFPVGSVLVKNFFYNLNEQDPTSERRILETRLLMHYQEGWIAETYVWNANQTSATRKQTGDQKNVTWVNDKGEQRNVNYLVPTKNECRACHSRNAELLPLGPEVQNLNKTYPYKNGSENQLVRWEQFGVLSGRPPLSESPQVPKWGDSSSGTLQERARIYLDVNCANCHNPTGVANYSGMYLNYDESEPFRLGVCKTPVAAGPGSGGLNYDIVPCKPDKSILVFRMKTTEPEARMPEIGRTLVHEEAVELIAEWVNNMECTSCEN